MNKTTQKYATLKEIVSICTMRKFYDLSCRNCTFRGSACEQFINKYGVLPHKYEKENKKEN